LVDLNDAMKKQAKLLVFNKGSSETYIKTQHVALENPRKRVVPNKFNHKVKRTHHMGALS